MEFTAEIREVTLPAALQLIQNGIATEITETPIRLSVGAGRGVGAGRLSKVGVMGNVRFAVMMGLSASTILVLVRIGTAYAMPGLGL
jgi:hypothetical protein